MNYKPSKNTRFHEISLDASSGEWTEWTSARIGQMLKNRIWYFTVRDCQNRLQDLVGADDSWKIHFELEVVNTDWTHFSYEQRGFMLPLTLLYLVSFAFLVIKGHQFYESYKRNDQEIDWPFLMALGALLFQNGSYFLETVHLYYYKQDGEGILFFNVFSQISSVCSQFLITVFLVLVSWGWTIKYEKLQ